MARSLFMQEKKSIWKWLFVFNFIFIPLLLVAKTTLIHNVGVRNTPTDVSICVKAYENSYDGLDKDVKPFIQITPRHAYVTSWSYNTLCLSHLKPRTKYNITLHKNMPLGANTLGEEYTFNARTLDYEPSFSFPDEGYILPTKGESYHPRRNDRGLSVKSLFVSYEYP